MPAALDNRVEIAPLRDLVERRIDQRQQLLFTDGGVEFCRKEILPHLPVGMDLPVVQACVHIANTITQPIASPAELRSYKPALQLAFQTLGLAEGSRRRELQTAHARNLFSDFVDRVAGLQTVMCNLIKTEQMENWPAAKLDEFLEKALPIKQQIERAEKLRLGLQ